MRVPGRLAVLDRALDTLVVRKPAGLACELPRDPAADSIVMRLRAQGHGDVRLVHRLDTPACGLLVVATSQPAAAHYSAEIAGRRWEKWYVAEVAAPIEQAAALVGRHRMYLSTEGRRAVVVRAGGKPAFLTVHHASASTAGPGRSLVLIELHTGRFHQIRVMLATLGAPLVGDTLYGAAPSPDFYLEHVALRAIPFGEAESRVWRSPAAGDRPLWPSDLGAALERALDPVSES